MALAGRGAVIRRFNRDTMVLTTGLLGTVIFAALVLAFQERHQRGGFAASRAIEGLAAKISEALNIGSYPPESTGLFSAAEVKDA